MQSTWLLVKMQRRSLVIVCGLMASGFLFINFPDFARNPSQATLIATVMLLLTVVSVAYIYLSQARMLALPFPITTRQRAWVPIILAALIHGAALTGVALGMLYWIVFRGLPAGMFEKAFLALAYMTVYVVMLELICLRFLHWHSEMIVFVLYSAMVYASYIEMIFDIQALLWLSIASMAIVFLICEVPFLTAALERERTFGSNTDRTSAHRDWSMLARPGRTKALADALSLGMVAGAIGMPFYIVYIFPYMITSRWAAQFGIAVDITIITDHVREDCAILITLAIAAALVGAVLARMVYCATVADGAGRWQAAGWTALRMTALAEPFYQLRTRGGSGALAVCDHCGEYKRLWMLACPHCAGAGPGTAVISVLPWRRRRC